MTKYEEAMIEFCPFKQLDLERAVDILERISDKSLYELCTEVADELDLKIEDIDPVWVVYEYALQEFRAEFESLFDVDILNDIEGMDVYANYLDTRFDYTSEWKERIIDILESNPEQDWSESAKFVFDECEINWVLDSKEK